MSSRRLLKAAEAIREVVSMAILTEIRDPRVQNVTVTGVEVAPDMKSAKVSVSVMGDESRQKLCLRGLQSSSGFLQSRIADRIDTRYTPRLTFSLDTGVKKSLEVERILTELAQERALQESSLQKSNPEETALTETTPSPSPIHSSSPSPPEPDSEDDHGDEPIVDLDTPAHGGSARPTPQAGDSAG